MSRARFLSVNPMGDSDPGNLPVRSLHDAIHFYERHMGFAVVSREASPASILLERDQVDIRIAENGGDPEQASVYIEVDDVDVAREELNESGAAPSPVTDMTHGSRSYRVFWVRAPDGLCYCLGQSTDQSGREA